MPLGEASSVAQVATGAREGDRAAIVRVRVVIGTVGRDNVQWFQAEMLGVADGGLLTPAG